MARPVGQRPQDTAACMAIALKSKALHIPEHQKHQMSRARKESLPHRLSIKKRMGAVRSSLDASRAALALARISTTKATR